MLIAIGKVIQHAFVNRPIFIIVLLLAIPVLYDGLYGQDSNITFSPFRNDGNDTVRIENLDLIYFIVIDTVSKDHDTKLLSNPNLKILKEYALRDKISNPFMGLIKYFNYIPAPSNGGCILRGMIKISNIGSIDLKNFEPPARFILFNSYYKDFLDKRLTGAVSTFKTIDIPNSNKKYIIYKLNSYDLLIDLIKDKEENKIHENLRFIHLGNDDLDTIYLEKIIKSDKLNFLVIDKILETESNFIHNSYLENLYLKSKTIPIDTLVNGYIYYYNQKLQDSLLSKKVCINKSIIKCNTDVMMDLKSGSPPWIFLISSYNPEKLELIQDKQSSNEIFLYKKYVDNNNKDLYIYKVNSYDVLDNIVYSQEKLNSKSKKKSALEISCGLINITNTYFISYQPRIVFNSSNIFSFFPYKTIDLNIDYIINHHWSVGAGFEISNTTFNIYTDSLNSSFTTFDSDNQVYNKNIYANQLYEEVNFKSNNVPLNLSYSFGKEFLDHVTVGMKLNFSHIENTIKEGEISYRGIYTEKDGFEYELSGIESLGFYENVKFTNIKTDIPLKGISWSVMIGYRRDIRITDRIGAYGKFEAGYNFNINIKQDKPYIISSMPYDYNSTLLSYNKIASCYFLFQFGVLIFL